VRQRRIFGDDRTRRIDDKPAEAIVNRLVKLLAALAREHPAEGWGPYLDDGAPRWERIVVAGHSQGAGMAAFIAQRRRVARVVLFSGPWDFFGPEARLAPWIRKGPGETPAERWFAAYHEQENAAQAIRDAYGSFKIPKDHVRGLKLRPAREGFGDPYHGSVVGDWVTPRGKDGSPAYADDWRFLLGEGAAVEK
jgi:pimeloyl-ACP methyl ester carboxylesterase